MTIYIFYATNTATAKVIYKQGSAEQNMEVYENVYLETRMGQIAIWQRASGKSIPVLTVPVSRTIIKHRDEFV